MMRAAVLALALVFLAPVAACDVGATGPDQTGTIDASADNADAGGLGFMESCVENEDCETGLCYAFNQGGPLCTHSCTVDTDCEAPSQGCNNMGVCKRPNGDNDNGDAGVPDAAP